MKNKLSFFPFFAIVLVSSQQSKTTYFDRSWKETTKDNAVFYRPAPIILNDSIEFIRDYFIDGKLQYQGYSLKKKGYKKNIGSEYWYNENGFDKGSDYSEANSEKFKGVELKFYYPNGKLWKIQKLNGKKTLEEVYFEGGNIRNIDSVNYADHQKGRVEKIYWINNKNLASEKIYNDVNELIKVKNYSQNGTLINEIEENNILDGYIIDHPYYEYDILNSFAVSSKLISVNDEISLSPVVEFSDANLIDCSTYTSIIKKNKYSYTYYNFKSWVTDASKKFRAYTELEDDDRMFSFKELHYDDKNFLLEIDKIKHQTIEDLKNDIKVKVFVVYNKEENLIYKYFFPSSEMVVKQVYKYDDQKNLELYTSDSSVAFIFKLGKNRPIISFKDSSDIFFVPLENGEYLINNTQVKTENRAENTISPVLEVKDHYTIVEENGKKIFVSVFGTFLLKGNFDDIIMNNYFIITKSGKDFSIYDVFLNKLNLKNIKSVYLNDNYINVLHDNKVEDLDSLLKEAPVRKYYRQSCGSDPYVYYNFSTAYDKRSRNNVIIRKADNYAFSEINTFQFNNLPKRSKYNFVYVSDSWAPERKDILQYFKNVEPYNNKEFYFIAKVHNKKGLYYIDEEKLDKIDDNIVLSFDDENLKFKNEYEEIKKESNYKFLENKYNDNDEWKRRYSNYNYKTNAVELLPRKYDDIIFKDNIIIFYKNKKYGVYKLSKEPKYKKIGIRKDNFLEITNEKDQQGWLDLITNIEYYN
jgi:hypothetical protein